MLRWVVNFVVMSTLRVVQNRAVESHHRGDTVIQQHTNVASRWIFVYIRCIGTCAALYLRLPKDGNIEVLKPLFLLHGAQSFLRS
jgi:hypothetical protein